MIQARTMTHDMPPVYLYKQKQYIGENGTGYSASHYTLIEIDGKKWIAGFVSKWDKNKKDTAPKTRKQIEDTARLKPITPLARVY